MQPECLAVSNGSRHDDIVCRTVLAIEELQAAGERISFYSVAERAQVSRSTLYRCDDLRKLVEAARANNAMLPQVQSATDDSRIAELECELARVSLERDLFKQIAQSSSSVQYALMKAAEAA